MNWLVGRLYRNRTCSKLAEIATGNWGAGKKQQAQHHGTLGGRERFLDVRGSRLFDMRPLAVSLFPEAVAAEAAHTSGAREVDFIYTGRGKGDY